MKNVRSLNAPRQHVRLPQSAHIEIRDSYFYGGQGSASASYGTEALLASDALMINSIFHRIVAPVMNPCVGCVVAYSYTYDNYYSACCRGTGNFYWLLACS